MAEKLCETCKLWTKPSWDTEFGTCYLPSAMKDKKQPAALAAIIHSGLAWIGTAKHFGCRFHEEKK